MRRFLYRNLEGNRLLVGVAVALTLAQVFADLLTAFPLKWILDKVVNHQDPTLPMGNGLTRLESRFWGRPAELAAARDAIGRRLVEGEVADLHLVTWLLDDLDFEDEFRIALEERASLSPDALTGMEANHRFVGPETIESKIFGRLSAWQNWIFYRPNASGPDGALRRYGSGQRGSYDHQRV